MGAGLRPARAGHSPAPTGDRVTAAALYREIAADLGVAAREHEPLAPYTWLKVGGPAEVVYFPDSAAQAARLFAALRGGPLPVRVLGAGSNLVVADEGLRAAVVATSRLHDEPRYLGEGRILASAGMPVPGLARWAARLDLAGLEFAEGIPALLGGALRMNAGAHGSSFSAVAERILIAAPDGALVERPVQDGDFAYRESFIHREQLIALGALLRLHGDDPDAIRGRMHEYRRRRRETQPVQERSAGCVFANFPGQPIGRVVEQLGLKGTAIGGAEVSSVHGNFIVNKGGARAADVLALIELVRGRIAEAVGQEPRLEVEIWRDPA